MSLYMHICGFSGAGKTTLGERIKNMGVNNLEIKDIDDFFYDDDNENMSNEERKNLTEKRINEYTKTVNSINPSYKIILVGTGCINTVVEEFISINPIYKVWLDVSIEESSKRRIKRQIDWMHDHKDEIINMMDSLSLGEINEYLNGYLNYKTSIICWAPLKDIAMVYNYKIMSGDSIMELIKTELIKSEK